MPDDAQHWPGSPDEWGPGVPPMPSTPPVAPTPPKRRNTKVLAAVGAVLVLAAGIGIGVSLNGGSSGGSTLTPEAASAPTQEASESPTNLCTSVVMDALQQTARALDNGQTGLNLTPLLYQYGTASSIYRIAVEAQGQMVANSIQQGAPDIQAQKMQPWVQAQCAQSSTPAATEPTTGSGTTPAIAAEPTPSSTSDFPFVEPPSISDMQQLGVQWTRYPSQSECEAVSVKPATVRQFAEQDDAAFASGHKSDGPAGMTLFAYMRKYTKELDAQGYPKPEDAVVAHLSDLCNTLLNSDPGQ